MAHGTEPIMPFDLAEATYLAPELSKPKSTEELIAIRANQLEKRSKELERMKEQVWKARKVSAEEFSKRFQRSIRQFDFAPGDLVLVRNSAIEMDLGKKWKPRYLGPFIVIQRSDRGVYTLAEMDGTVSRLRFSAKRVIPYKIRDLDDLPDTTLDDVQAEESEAE
jgi:hypothetical protein